MISDTSEEFICLVLQRHGEIFVPVGMIFGNFQTQGEKLHYASFVDLHELFIFGGEYQRRRVAEIYKAKMPAGTDFAVQHGRNFTRIVIRIASQSVAGSDGLRQPEIDLLEEVWRRFPVRSSSESMKA